MTLSTFTLRVLEAEDAVAFQAVRLRALREHPTAFAASPEDEAVTPLETVAAQIAAGADAAVLGAFDADARLVAIAGVQREAGAKLAHKACLWGVYVVPQARGQGLGRLLVGEALAHAARELGVRQVNLGVAAANAAARALYESLGFEPFGLERAYLMHDGVPHDELHMVRVLVPHEGDADDPRAH